MAENQEYYTVKSPLRHDGKTYPIGATAAIDDETAEKLHGLGVIDFAPTHPAAAKAAQETAEAPDASKRTGK